MTEEEQKIVDHKHATEISIKLVNDFCDNFYSMAVERKASGKVQPMVWEVGIRMLLNSFHIMCCDIGITDKRIKEICHSYVDQINEPLSGIDCKSAQIHHVDFK